MSIKYNIFCEKNTELYFALIIEKIIEAFPRACFAKESHKLLLVNIMDPNWADFSMEKSATGFFIREYLSGTERQQIFSLIDAAFIELGIDYTIKGI